MEGPYNFYLNKPKERLHDTRPHLQIFANFAKLNYREI